MRHLFSLGWNGTFQAPVSRRAPVVTRLSLSPVHDGYKRAPSTRTEHFVRETQLVLQTCPAVRTPGSRSNDKRRRLPPRRAVASMPALFLRPASLPGSDSGPLSCQMCPGAYASLRASETIDDVPSAATVAIGPGPCCGLVSAS